jgi:hypothetical protein
MQNFLTQLMRHAAAVARRMAFSSTGRMSSLFLRECRVMIVATNQGSQKQVNQTDGEDI